MLIQDILLTEAQNKFQRDYGQRHDFQCQDVLDSIEEVTTRLLAEFA